MSRHARRTIRVSNHRSGSGVVQLLAYVGNSYNKIFCQFFEGSGQLDSDGSADKTSIMAHATVEIQGTLSSTSCLSNAK